MEAKAARSKPGGFRLPHRMEGPLRAYLRDPIPETAHVSVRVEFRGPLDPSALRRALGTIVADNLALRATLREAGGIHGRFAQRWVLPLKEVDLSQSTQAAQSRLAKGLTREVTQSRFDLTRDLPVRFLLLKFGPLRYDLILVFSHFFIDGRSVELVLSQLLDRYTRRGTRPTAPRARARVNPFPILANEHDLLMQESGELLEGIEDAAIVPDRPSRDPAIRNSRYLLEPALVDRLQSLAKDCQSTLPTLMLGILAASVWSKKAGRPLLIASFWSGRTAATRALVGPLSRPSFVQIQLAAGDSLSDLFQRSFWGFVRGTRDFYPVWAHAVRQSRAATGKVAVTFNFFDEPDSPRTRRLGKTTVDWWYLHPERGRGRVGLHVEPTPRGLELLIRHRKDAFDVKTINRFVAHYLRLLARAAGPKRPRTVGELLAAAPRASGVRAPPRHRVRARIPAPP